MHPADPKYYMQHMIPLQRLAVRPCEVLTALAARRTEQPHTEPRSQ